MLTLPKSLKIYATTMPCDMRKQADGLLGTVNTVLGRPAAQHELYLFWSRRKNLIKVLYLDPTGVCVFAKRINQGAFEVSFGQTPGQASVTLDAATLGSIVAATHSMNAKPRKRLASLAH